MSEIIQLTDGLRIRRLDRMNVAVERLVTPKDGEQRWEPANGQGRGPFCGSEAVACRWVLDHGLVDGAGETDLQGAVAAYERAAEQLARAVEKATS